MPAVAAERHPSCCWRVKPSSRPVVLDVSPSSIAIFFVSKIGSPFSRGRAPHRSSEIFHGVSQAACRAMKFSGLALEPLPLYSHYLLFHVTCPFPHRTTFSKLSAPTSPRTLRHAPHPVLRTLQPHPYPSSHPALLPAPSLIAPLVASGGSEPVSTSSTQYEFKGGMALCVRVHSSILESGV